MIPIYLKQKLELAIKNGQLAVIDYVSKKHEITYGRVIEPKELIFEGEEPVAIHGHCYLRNELRNFWFEGVQKLQIIEKDQLEEFKKLTVERKVEK